ncbi:MAG: amidohydrolase/deacetylase family metallohydrolase [Caldilineaceae bacterium]|nr:amidohydrolase/deacetylase family metallohydrolase [Caldilineaceae bacterium]MCB0121946.1 amidohydrolase/deacetylase family metallohydrolase [Caldilineaceae bacterium]
MQFDLLIKGGEVVDPGGNQRGKLDVAIRRNRIAAVDHNIPVESARRVVDATGQYVTPGLVDLHTHVYHSATCWGIRADPVAARSGVTTWLDVGSSGAYNFPGFREFIVKPATARIYALLNISSIGLTASTWELSNLNYLDVDLCTKLIDHNRDLILGVKVRIDRNTTSGTGIAGLERGRQAAELCGLPLMAHIGYGPPTLDEVLTLLRPGDILTHCFTGGTMRIIGDDGALLEIAKRAWDSGVIMDIGHGAGSFSFATAASLIDAGYRPDVISSDIHQFSVHGPLFDLPTCLSKFLALGMSLEQVIAASTIRPAEVMGMQNEIGTLKVGALADVALWELEEGDFTLYDVHMTPRQGRQLLHNTLTLIDGRELAHASDDPPMPWIAITEQQQALIEQGHTPEHMVRQAKAGTGCTC